MKPVKYISSLVLVTFFAAVLFSCQKGGEPVPYFDEQGVEKVCDKDSSANQRGDESGDNGSSGETGTSNSTGTKGGNNGGGSSGGDDNVIGGDDNEDDDDVVEDFDFGDEPKNGDDNSSGNGGV